MVSRVRRTTAAALPAMVALLVVSVSAGCGSSAEDEETLTVLAAASLQDTFTELGEEFEREHPGVDVRLSFGGSSGLAEQIEGGAPADVFASANAETMDRLLGDDLVRAPEEFATNTLEIAVPPGNPAQIEGLTDLADPDVRLVACAAEVPCGDAAIRVADAAGVELSPVSEEQSVTDVLGKVRAGEADAGLVYVTDVTAAGDDVAGVPFPESGEAVNTYPIATVTGSDHEDPAADFVALVRSERGRHVLTGAGFGTP